MGGRGRSRVGAAPVPAHVSASSQHQSWPTPENTHQILPFKIPSYSGLSI